MDKAVIFDMDGTIWDAVDQAVIAWDAVMRKAGHEEGMSHERMQGMMGKTIQQFAKELFPELEYERALMIVNECLFDETDIIRDNGAALYGDVKEVFEKIHDKGYDVAIVSNCQAGYIEAFLDYYDMNDVVDDYEENGRTGLYKADNLKLLIERNGYKEYFYVGDTQGDMDACREAGVPFVWASYGFGTAEGYDRKVDSLEEVVKLL